MTTPPAGYRFVDATDRQEEFVDVDRMAFGMASDPEVDAVVPMTLDWDRAVAVEDADGRLAGVHASFPFGMPVPGASVPTSGLTWVGVRPDHRRRGLLQAMIATHFERSLLRGEPVSALFAAEAGIYGRFGYGSAADGVRLTLDRRAPLREVDGRCWPPRPPSGGRWRRCAAGGGEPADGNRTEAPRQREASYAASWSIRRW